MTLDQQFVGYGMCDVMVCTELPIPYTVKLIEYRQAGEQAPPDQSGSMTNAPRPVYRTVPLTGDIKVNVAYYSDKDCQQPKAFSTILHR